MKKQIIDVDKTRGVFRATTTDERFYIKTTKSPKTGLPTYDFYPSTTWITSYYPKGYWFTQWQKKVGLDEAELIKNLAGERGSKVHYACSDLAIGKEIRMDSKYLNPTTEQEEELKPDEYGCVMKFAKWLDKTKPQILAIEQTLFNEEHHYAGTVDYVLRIDGQIYLIDLKTAQGVYPDYKLQISAYSHLDFTPKIVPVSKAEWNNRKLAILQVGYRRNKDGYKFTEVDDQFDVFLATKKLWANENPDTKPKQVEYPITLQMNLTNQGKITGILEPQIKKPKK